MLKIREVKEEEFEEVGDMSINAFLGLPGYCLSEMSVNQIRDVRGRYNSPVATVLVATLPTTSTTNEEKIVGTATFISGPGPFAEVSDEDAAGNFPRPLHIVTYCLLGMRVVAVAKEAQLVYLLILNSFFK